MKFHLPKKLMVAVLAALSASTVQAGYYTIGQKFHVDAGTPIEQATISEATIAAQTTYAPFVKDGNGTAYITESGSVSSAIYIREGKLLVQGTDENSVIFTLSPEKTSSQDGCNWINVAGKDSELIIDNATIKGGVDSSISVGGADGNGNLTVKNASTITGTMSFFVGMTNYGNQDPQTIIGCNNSHATTNNTGDELTAENRYQGNYYDTGNKWGKATVNITNSKVYTGWGGLYMGEGVLNVSGAQSELSTGKELIDAIGYQNNCKSVINVTDSATYRAGNAFYTGYHAANTESIVNVDNATFDIKKGLWLGVGSSVNGVWVANGSTSTFNLTNGGTLSADSFNLSYRGDKTSLNIDTTSKATTNKVTIGSNATINNAGTLEAGTVGINNGGTLTMIGASAELKSDSVSVNDGGTLQVEGGEATTLSNVNVTVYEGGIISLKDGSTLNVTGALTMESGSILRLSATGYEAGDTVLSSDSGDLDVDGATLEVVGGQANYIIENGTIIITAVFDNSIAEALTVTNWGIASASRTFVNAVRGQRTNTGCIANGRGTAWAAVLGGTSDIGNGDIDLKGAAVGADMKVGEKSSVGVAVGYIDGDARIPGMSKAEQEGSYVALYGEHGLKKLSATSCLSLDWVAAYGQTETEWESADWEQQSLQLNTRLNWNKKVTDRLCMSVFGGLEYFTSESDRVENVKTGSIQNLRGEIGVGARYVAWGTPGTAASYDEKGALVTASRPGCEKLVLHGEIRYMNDLVRSNPVIEQDGLRGDGENPGRQGMGIEAGATYRIGERWSASANYSFNALDDSREHRVNVGASYTF